MKRQGMSEGDIIANLRDQGINPLEIKQALDQVEIKQAVSDNDYNGGMQESIMGQEEYIPEAPAPAEGYYDQQAYAPQPQQADAGYYDASYAAGGYDNSGYGQGSMIEVAEQVFSERIKKFQKDLNEVKEFKTIAQTQIENISERLKKLERTIDKLQLAILDKVGSYSDDLQGIKKEMGMMQDSFRKIADVAGSKHTRKR